MKILIFSDSHGAVDEMEQAVQATPDAAMILHLGDCTRDAALLSSLFPAIPMRSVCGNNDFYPDIPSQMTIVIGGHRVFLCHGHLYHVKYSLDRLLSAAREQKAELALFGHTHIPLCENRDGIYLLNPGSIRGQAGTYGTAELGEDGIRIKTMFLRKGGRFYV